MSPLEYVGERPEYKRRWDRDHLRDTCECGATKWAKALRCIDCQKAAVAAEREAQWREVQALWLAGASLRDIGEHLGWKERNAASVLVDRMRKAGWDMPYRYRRRAGA